MTYLVSCFHCFFLCFFATSFTGALVAVLSLGLLSTHCIAPADMVYSLYKLKRILHYRIVKGFRPPTIVKLLREEGMTASERKFIKTFMSTGRRLT